jgi:hypothetical protein
VLDAGYTQLTRENMAFDYDFVKSAKLLKEICNDIYSFYWLSFHSNSSLWAIAGALTLILCLFKASSNGLILS